MSYNDETLLSCGRPFRTRKDEIDLGDLGLWSVSSAKPGFGVNNLRDDSVNTLWQSEGPQPHFIRIEFPKRMVVTVCRFDSKKSLGNDSYTPSKLSISVGTFKQDLQVLKTVELINPGGWQHIRLVDRWEEDAGDDDDSDDSESGFAAKGHLFQIAVLANHLNGKDTHIRCLKILGPRSQWKQRWDTFVPNRHELLLMHETIR